MKNLLLLIPLVLASCESVPPFYLDAAVRGQGATVGIAKSNTKQHLFGGQAAVTLQAVSTAVGLPLWGWSADANTLRFIDTTLDPTIDETTAWGEPIHPNAAVLFMPGEADLLGITFRPAS